MAIMRDSCATNVLAISSETVSRSLTGLERHDLARHVSDPEYRTIPQSADPDRAEAVAEKLATGTWTHDYPIWATTAKELGLPVRTDMPLRVRSNGAPEKRSCDRRQTSGRRPRRMENQSSGTSSSVI
jgi:hypothetical protein